MQDDFQEKDASPELSRKELLSEMSLRADEIIIDSETTNIVPSPYFGIKKNISEAGVETSSLLSRSGAELNRIRNPETGDTLYQLSILYFTSADKGSSEYTWTTLEPSMSQTVNSEIDGRSEPKVYTDSSAIKPVQLMLEKYFPLQPTHEASDAKSSFMSTEKMADTFKPKLGSKLLKFVGVKKPYQAQMAKYQTARKNLGLEEL